MFINENLKKCREEKGLTQTDVIFKLYEKGVRISRQTLINWESGSTTPNANEAQVLASILDQPIEFFFDDKSFLSGKVIDK